MSILKKSIAVALLTTAVVSTAAAFDLGASRAAAEFQFRISGATAFTNSLDSLMKSDSTTTTDNPCVTTTLDTYRIANGANAVLPKDAFIWACEMNMASSFVANLNTQRAAETLPLITAGTLAEFYKVDTGSGGGVRPFVPVAGETVTFPNVNGGNVSIAACPINATSGNQDCANLDLATDADILGINNGLDIGTSDVEPALFGFPDTAAYVQDGGSLVWGLPVSIDLRDALQAHQFTASNVCNPANAAYNNQATQPDGVTLMTDLNGATVSNRESETCQPSLQREVVNSILTGKITDWRFILNTKGEFISATGATAGTTPRGGDYTVYICRRGSSSGTQASYEAVYAKQRCTVGVSPILAPSLGNAIKGADAFAQVTCPGLGHACGAPTGSLFTPATRVFAGGGTGDVRECLTLHSQDATNSNGDGTYAIGIFATENVADDARVGNTAFGTLPQRRFRHIKVNGMMGSLLNSANGQYPYFSEVTIQTHANGAGPKSDLMRAAMVDAFKKAVSTPSVLAGINASAVHPWGQGGFLAAMDSAGVAYAPTSYPLNAAEVAALPLTPLSKHSIGSVNNCQEPVFQGGNRFIVATPHNNATNSNATTDALLP